MTDLRPPATGTEAYLAAILDELRVISAAVGGGGTQEPPVGTMVQVDGRALPASMLQPTTFDPSVPEPDAKPAPTKRTRQRTPRTT